MEKLLLSEATDKMVGQFLASPVHGLLIVAPTGAGKSSLATRLASDLLNLEGAKLSSYPYFLRLKAEESEILSIDSIRELTHFLTLRTTGSLDSVRRVVIIEDGDKLSHQAQNALLKTLEEPPLDTVIIITAVDQGALLPTVLSRLRTLPLITPHRESIIQHFRSLKYPEEAIEQAYLMSTGLPGLMLSILESDASHPLRLATDSARKLLSASLFDKLILAENLAKDKALTKDVLLIIERMSSKAMEYSRDNRRTVARWAKVAEATYGAIDSLSKNANPRLVMLNYAVSL